jgi:hypothetical protein
LAILLSIEADLNTKMSNEQIGCERDVPEEFGRVDTRQ